MQVGKWGNSLAVRLPKAVVDALGLEEGDEIEIGVTGDKAMTVAKDASRERALKTLDRLRRPFPKGWKFDRDEANAR